jgi:hypothetical protein
MLLAIWSEVKAVQGDAAMQERGRPIPSYEPAQARPLGDKCPKMWCVGYCSKNYCPFLYCGAGYFEDVPIGNRRFGPLHNEVDTP